MLDTSRIEAGTFSFRFQEVDLGQLVHDTVATAQVGQDEVRLRADVRSPLPEIRGDRDRLRQVLTNLIDNAIKYSPAGGEVEVRAYPEDGRVLVDVRDHGPGIAKDDQKLIFEKFGRVTGAGTTRPGPASASSSPARSPRPTAAGSRCSRHPSRARRSRSSCRSPARRRGRARGRALAARPWRGRRSRGGAPAARARPPRRGS